jgi:hypothetical protein
MSGCAGNVAGVLANAPGGRPAQDGRTLFRLFIGLRTLGFVYYTVNKSVQVPS